MKQQLLHNGSFEAGWEDKPTIKIVTFPEMPDDRVTLRPANWPISSAVTLMNIAIDPNDFSAERDTAGYTCALCGQRVNWGSIHICPRLNG